MNPLLAPAVPDTATGAPDTNWLSLKNWMSDPLISGTPTPEPTAKPKEEPSGKDNPKPGPAVDKPATQPGVADDGKGGQPGDTGAVGGKADDQPPAAPPAKADEKPGVLDNGVSAKPGAKAEGKEEFWEKAPQPKTVKDWDKLKSKWGETATAFKAQIAEKDTELTVLKSRVAELESTKPASEEPSESVKAQLAAKDQQIKALHETIITLEVTEDPKFKSYFKDKYDAAISDAKSAVGQEHAEAVEKLITMPDGEYKRAQVEEFMSNLDESQKIDLRVAMADYKKVNKERDAAIKDAQSLKDKINGENTSKRDSLLKNRESVFNDAVKRFSDPKTGFPMYQTKTGDDAWNADVQKRIDAAKGLLFSNNVKPEAMATAAFYAVAFPAVLKAWTTDAQKWSEEKAGFEAKISEMVTAQPTGGGGAAHEADDGRVKLTPDMSPADVTKAWAAAARKQLGA